MPPPSPLPLKRQSHDVAIRTKKRDQVKEEGGEGGKSRRGKGIRGGGRKVKKGRVGQVKEGRGRQVEGERLSRREG